jgi:hypothetical protein
MVTVTIGIRIKNILFGCFGDLVFGDLSIAIARRPGVGGVGSIDTKYFNRDCFGILDSIDCRSFNGPIGFLPSKDVMTNTL